MTEKLAYTPSRVIPLSPKPPATAAGNATRSRSFAELLAEAEAVQDVVQLEGRVGPATPGVRGSIHSALHGMAGLVLGPLPRWVLHLRGEKPRREAARG